MVQAPLPTPKAILPATAVQDASGSTVFGVGVWLRESSGKSLFTNRVAFEDAHGSPATSWPRCRPLGIPQSPVAGPERKFLFRVKRKVLKRQPPGRKRGRAVPVDASIDFVKFRVPPFLLPPTRRCPQKRMKPGISDFSRNRCQTFPSDGHFLNRKITLSRCKLLQSWLLSCHLGISSKSHPYNELACSLLG